MSRMLQALRQIESRSPEAPISWQPGPPPVLPAMPVLPQAEEPEAAPAVLPPLPQAEEPEPPVAAPFTLPADLLPAAEPVLDNVAEPIETQDLSQEQDRGRLARQPAAAPRETPEIGPQASSYGRLAEKLLASLPGGLPATVLFTSPGDGTGTTGVLLPLAAAMMEQIAGKALLVDGNLVRPQLTAALEIEPAAGLAEVILGEALWRDLVRETPCPRLSVLPSVRRSGRPAGSMVRTDAAPLLREWRAEYELVLVDAASLAHAEAALLVRHCDATCLVVRLGHTPRRALGEAVQAVEANAGRLLGCIVIETTAPAGLGGW